MCLKGVRVKGFVFEAAINKLAFFNHLIYGKEGASIPLIQNDYSHGIVQADPE